MHNHILVDKHTLGIGIAEGITSIGTNSDIQHAARQLQESNAALQ